ncbi:Gfo/Idh/MocA family oxidoreductase [Aliifodinibius salicampi]|uniref:Gfo/Idh/MocA family oxidoreductase n=1 Tax=Fodinibius salicampi TaxID=1920655 RepID=A0ABT3PV97_9BACT|nr:Gfo/Idh/MocA family oxidoreductase [Fodinibius salicampi]MCW9711736.1 Gfo/Idh/MocA family oxidoreductase [Fodinibius salicampi]
MIIVDKALEKREKEKNPIKVGMVGAGFMGKGIALQIHAATKGMRLVAISNRDKEKAYKAYSKAGIKNVEEVDSVDKLDSAVRNNKSTVTDNPFLLCKSAEIDVIVEVTGAVKFSAEVVLEAIQNKKHVVLMNAELDGTVGPILKVYADKNDVIITNADGDQPGVIMNLYRFVKGIGVKPVLCGNIKGLHDPYRNPTTQEGFAKKWGQKPSMVTSFADGSKISFEQAIVANATNMKVGKRGMYGPTVPSGTPISEVIREYPEELLEIEQGVVDYVVGAVPGPGVFIIGTHDNPTQQHYLNLYKLGEGPYYCFHTPYHLCHFEVPNTIVRAALFDDATIAPNGGPSVEVITIAKKDLKAGEVIDGIGHYMTYGVCENAEVTDSENLLPLGVAEGCTLKKDIAKDQAITYDDVKVPEGRLIDQLRIEQKKYFS